MTRRSHGRLTLKPARALLKTLFRRYSCFRCSAPEVSRVHLVLVAIDAHLIANDKSIDFRYVAHRSRGQYTVQTPRESVGVLFENLACIQGRARKR